MNSIEALIWQQLEQKFQLFRREFVVAGKPIKIFTVANNYELLDQIDPEEFQRDEKMPYWAEVWPSSVALADFLLSDLSLKETPCLELGCGVGVVSVAAALAGAKALAIDYFTEALEFVKLNAAANQTTVETQWLDWRDITITQRFPVILAADVLYEQRNHLPVFHALQRLLDPQGRVYITDPQRPIAQKFLDLVRENGWTVETTLRSQPWDTLQLPIDLHCLQSPRG